MSVPMRVVLESLAHANAMLPEELIANVPPLTDGQVEQLKTLGREGCLAIPMCGMTLDEAPLGSRLQRWNWRVWMGPDFPNLRFMRNEAAS